MYSVGELINETKTKNPRLGKCYELSGRYVLHHDGTTLVHGRITNPLPGGHRAIDHAWVILSDGDYFDPVTELVWSKDVFEKFYKPVTIYKIYDHLHVCTQLMRHKHWGPWDDAVVESSETLSFQTSLSPRTVKAIKEKLFNGMTVWRGVKTNTRPADPGDLGKGTYFTTMFVRARCYGQPSPFVVKLMNPLVLTDSEAYQQIADRFGTITGDPNSHGSGAGEMAKRAVCSEEATRVMQSLGYDGVASICQRHGEIEIVKFPLK